MLCHADVPFGNPCCPRSGIEAEPVTGGDMEVKKELEVMFVLHDGRRVASGTQTLFRLYQRWLPGEVL
jgi:hypothetical protein